MSDKKHLKAFRGEVFRQHRESRNGHRGGVFWFTGLSGSGKSTIAHAVEKRLFDMGMDAYVFDGDNVRHGLCSDLSFSPEARTENVRRIGEVAKLFADAGTICLCAFITPLCRDRDRLRQILCHDYSEVYVSCPVSVCEERDAKGYYKLAREGKIKNYTGISAPYDEPSRPDIVLRTNRESLDQCVERMIGFIQERVALDRSTGDPGEDGGDASGSPLI